MQTPCLYIYDIDLVGQLASKTPMRIRSKMMRGTVLAHHLNTPVETLNFVDLPHGKPRLANHPDCYFNVSHSGPIWAMLVAGGHDVGLDVEIHKPRPMMDSVVEAYFHPDEINAYHAIEKGSPARSDLFFMLWTQKEARAKLSGHGLSQAAFSQEQSDGVHVLSNKFILPHLQKEISVSIASETLIQSPEIKSNFYLEIPITSSAQ